MMLDGGVENLWAVVGEHQCRFRFNQNLALVSTDSFMALSYATNGHLHVLYGSVCVCADTMYNLPSNRAGLQVSDHTYLFPRNTFTKPPGTDCRLFL
jgi:hypothetical protein